MNLRKGHKAMPEVSTSSLNDIMFFLMLFFLIMSTMVSPGVINLTLPNAKPHQTMQKTEVSIEVSKDLQYSINRKIVPFEQIEPELVKILNAASDKETTVVLKCDQAVTVQDLVNILEIGSKLKVRMILATKSPNGNG